MPDTETTEKARDSVWVLAGDTVLLAILGVLTFFVFPEFREIYSDVEVTLPALTRILVISPPVIHALVLVGLAAVLIVKERYIRNKSVTLALNTVGLFAVATLLGLAILALFIPMVRG